MSDSETASAPGPVVRILRIASGGDGVGRMEDGRTVFVPRTAPGDLVELTQIRLERRLARARVRRLLEPSPDRVPPPCPHYVADDCGGCQLQHMSADAQREARRGIVGDALRRLAHLDVPDPPLVPAARDFGYRTKLTLHVSADGRRIGLHPYGRADRVFELDRCHITRDELNELWLACRRARAKLPPRLLRVVLRLDRQGGRHIILETGPGEVWTGGPALHAAIAAAGISATVWWRPEGGAPRAVAGSDTAFPATAFEQVHPEMGDLVRAHALARLGAEPGLLVWDLYAGMGETTDRLLEAGARVESVESDRRAAAHAEARGRQGAVERHVGRAEDVAGRMKRPDLVITNPPRTGMDGRVTDVLSQSGARRIVYVSCDPATLARDLTRLAPRYRLEDIVAFDLFPQTAHVETVAVLERT